MPDGEFICDYSGCRCGKEFPSQKSLSGHLGGVTKVLGEPGHIREHGTRRGYETEVRNGVPTCVPCRRANAKYMQVYTAKGRVAARKGK